MKSACQLLFRGLLPLLLWQGCSRTDNAADVVIDSPKDLVGRKCAVMVGTMMADMTSSIQPGIEFVWFNDFNSEVEALRLKKVDAMPCDAPYAGRWVAANPDSLAITKPYHSLPWAYFFRKNSPLRDRVNAILADLKRTGELKRIIDKWCVPADISKIPLEVWTHRKDFTGAAGVFRFATPADHEPGSFTREDGIFGFDIDLARRIAYELDMKFELMQIGMSAIVPAIQSGKAEMGGGCISITKERSEKVDFTDCYLPAQFVFLIRKSSSINAGRVIASAADLKGKRVAHMSSGFHRQELLSLQPDIEFCPYSEYAMAVASLRSGKIDAISLGKSYYEVWSAKFPDEFSCAFDYAKDECAFLMPKGSKLKKKVDAILTQMNASGETAAIVGRWLAAAKRGETPKFIPPEFPADAPVLRVASAAQAEPWCFVGEGKTLGADIEIIYTIAKHLGMRPQPTIFSWGGMLDCVNAGKCDLANGGIYVAGLTLPTVDRTVAYAQEEMCIMTLDSDRPNVSLGVRDFLSSIKASFIRTFVTENRWKMMADGLGITIFITLLSSVLGTLLAFPVWLMRTAKNRFVALGAKVYISILQGTPVLVILMVLFYLVFGSVDIDGLWVAIIGFSLNASAYIGEMLRSGIDSIPRGQTEAALALGYRPKRAFFRVVLPQAVRAILPVYRGELIGLLKSTSIVGYIAINDLTKASDLVRSRTYESFFPILTTAFIYFVVAWLLAKLLDAFGKSLDPRKGGEK